MTMINKNNLILPEKAYCLTGTYYKKGSEATRQRCIAKSQRPVVWINEKETRWLTPIECERLQTLPDNYTGGVSDTQRYKAIGNGWTVDAVKHIFSFI